jgi:alanine racemase
LSWKAKIVEVKFLPKGSAISYGCTHILSRDSKLAVLPIGYFDGIPRISSGIFFPPKSSKTAKKMSNHSMPPAIPKIKNSVFIRILF